MNKLIFILTTMVFFSLTSCNKERNKSATVIKDCTGAYLRIDGKDYQVCNLEKVSSFSNGSVVKATFRKINVCNGSAKDAIVCFMFHQNEGWIEVNKIK